MRNPLIAALVFITLNSYAQDGKFSSFDVGKSFRGFVIMGNNDTIRGTFKIEPMYVMQNEMNLTTDKKEKYVWYKPDYVKYCELENKTKWYSSKFYTTLKAPDDSKRKDKEAFLIVSINGPITIYQYNFYDSSTNPPKNQESEYFLLPNGETINASTLILGFRKKMAEIVKDYPELAAKITNKEKGYGMIGVYDIIREYNKWYMEKHPDFKILR